ncbi:MAG TPA: UDP-N-acetylmuramate dehydrogenase [Terriglobales bacterium]|nr:UDP-N-acetylmuramate dehydrogenase [Terriglobales bacterium]
MIVQENVPLAPLTTFKIGGPARYFIEAKTVDEVKEAFSFSRERSLPLFIMGGGSNLLIADAGWPGVVLKVGILGINHAHGHDRVIFEAGAGEDWDSFVSITVAHNCAGLECLSGIPGSVGGTPVQNVGAYGQEAADTIESVQALDLTTGEVCELEKEDCGFRYRTSIFNTTEHGRYVILQVNFALKHGAPARVEYGDLKKYFSGWTSPPTLAQTREAVRQIRATKAMLITPGDENCRSAGSFFKNPVLTAEAHDQLLLLAAAKRFHLPSYPALDAQRKVSAAWLVEHSGFSKGYTLGRVGISRKHALAIVNRGGATANEVVALEEQIRSRVEQIWNIRLEPEPVFVGF